MLQAASEELVFSNKIALQTFFFLFGVPVFESDVRFFWYQLYYNVFCLRFNDITYRFLLELNT